LASVGWDFWQAPRGRIGQFGRHEEGKREEFRDYSRDFSPEVVVSCPIGASVGVGLFKGLG
jgi:hypothetical protein